MRQSERHSGKKPRPGDFIAAGAVVVCALVLLLAPLLRPQEASLVEIRQDGKLLAALPLSVDATYTVGGAFENTIEIRNGAVRVTHATCPGGDCVHTGAITSGSIVCLPNRVEIRITGGADAVIG